MNPLDQHAVKLKKDIRDRESRQKTQGNRVRQILESGCEAQEAALCDYRGPGQPTVEPLKTLVSILCHGCI